MSRLREALDPYSLRHWQNWIAYPVVLLILWQFAPESAHRALSEHFRSQAEIAEETGTAGNYGE